MLRAHSWYAFPSIENQTCNHYIQYMKKGNTMMTLINKFRKFWNKFRKFWNELEKLHRKKQLENERLHRKMWGKD